MTGTPLTLERMRADIAAMVHEEPGAIGDHDNLMDLGIDSMRALNLILQWSDLGVELDFADMAEEVTLAGWWEAARTQMAKRESSPDGH